MSGHELVNRLCGQRPARERSLRELRLVAEFERSEDSAIFIGRNIEPGLTAYRSLKKRVSS